MIYKPYTKTVLEFLGYILLNKALNITNHFCEFCSTTYYWR